MSWSRNPLVNLESFSPDGLLRRFGGSLKGWSWQYVFASSRFNTDPRSGRMMQHHVSENLLQADSDVRTDTPIFEPFLRLPDGLNIVSAIRSRHHL